MVNLFTRHDSWQMAASITKFSLSPNLPELRISIPTMSTMGGYYAIGNYVEGRLLYYRTIFLMKDLTWKEFKVAALVAAVKRYNEGAIHAPADTEDVEMLAEVPSDLDEEKS